MTISNTFTGITGGNIDGTPIGTNSPSTAAFTTVSSNVENINTFRTSIAIVSAAGTAQATASPISINIGIVRLQGAADGQTTGFLLPSPAGNVGVEQTLYNENAVSANLWPNSGCKINGLANNAAFGMLANTAYTVIYYAASAYGVK